MNKCKESGGFSYIEMILVITLMLILGGIVAGNGRSIVSRAKRIAAGAQIRVFETALSAYELDCGSYPSEGQGLKALWEKPSLYPVPEEWNGPYLSSPPGRDPWGNEYCYRPEMTGDQTCLLLSWGADGREGGVGIDEDISNRQ